MTFKEKVCLLALLQVARICAPVSWGQHKPAEEIGELISEIRQHKGEKAA